MLQHCIPEHQVHTYDDSEGPGDLTARLNPSSRDAVSLMNESSQRPNQSSSQAAMSNTQLRADVPDQREDQQKLARCLSDPSPNKE